MSNSVTFFDEPYYIEINRARWAMAEAVLDRLPRLDRCIDVGCGPGWFSERLVKRGLDVLGLDGRDELVVAAAARVPKGKFITQDITNPNAVQDLQPAELVFCFGLLYHLENPFAAIRNLHRITAQYLFIETQIAPGEGNNLVLVSEGQNQTQGLKFHAVIPSRRALVKMLYVAGFTSVHRYTGVVQHDDFTDSLERRHRREVFMVAKNVALSLPDFILESEPATPKIDYSR
ncbi:class I SAM-dependent methyltransferase [Rhizobium sp. Pop5]|uniref:class I SAM-dependent methyltransferase n=1 Tax=Rhizobium sp. Pop5 TaxID=1223565 RepID=UPI000283D418|nr:methyltransferase domain-containing protein [Rhizobium sp. Pop5]EJZ20298.1 FkbM family methyltransferase [Rhizobium sp. Pop5]UVD57480.1 class I SAM-dependent methyltransferase [Rhizobium sp. Pop5]